jgi:hypothetical protein
MLKAEMPRGEKKSSKENRKKMVSDSEVVREKELKKIGKNGIPKRNLYGA